MTRVIILAAGDGTRWSNFRDNPKHLTEIEGERLIDRTVRQYLNYTDDVTVVGSDERYLIPRAQLFVPDRPMEFVYPITKPRPWKEMDKFGSSMHLWGEGRTVLVYGDVYFTDDAVKTVMENNEEWKCFCRTKPSQVTGKNCKEIFAYSLGPEHHREFKYAIEYLMKSKTATGGWSLFRYLTTKNENVNANYETMFSNNNFVEIDDWTEDFDFPNDLITWEDRRKAINVN